MREKMSSNISYLIEKGDECLKAGDLDAAICNYNDAIEIEPNNLDVLYKKGYVHLELKQFDEARRCFSKLNSLNSDYIFSKYIPVGPGMMRAEKNFSDALQVLKILTFLEPTRIDWLENKAFCLARLGFTNDAIDCQNKIIEIDPKNIKSIAEKSNLLDSIGRWEDAIKCYDDIMSISGNLDWLLVEKGKILAENNLHHKALECFKKAQIIKNDTETDPVLALLIGISLYAIGEYQEALTYFDGILSAAEPMEECKEYDNFIRERYYKGVTLESMGNHDEAMTIFTHILNYHPEWNHKDLIEIKTKIRTLLGNDATQKILDS